jgi:hypothetical protein
MLIPVRQIAPRKGRRVSKHEIHVFHIGYVPMCHVAVKVTYLEEWSSGCLSELSAAIPCSTLSRRLIIALP